MLIIFTLMFFHFRAGVKVIVINQSETSIKDISLIFTGGAISLSELKTGDTWRTRVQPKGESSLKIEFLDKDRKKHSEDLGVYIETGYKGGIFIEINPDGNISMKDNYAYPSMY